MKKMKIVYWVVTGLMAALMLMASIPDVLQIPEAVAVFKHLGYPSYLLPFIGVAKILAVITILVPGFPRLKEWAYAAAEQAVGILRRNHVEGFWIHVDADVLDDAVMPAVEYHLAGGLSWDELSGDIARIDGNRSGGWNERRHLQPCHGRRWFNRARVGLLPGRRTAVGRALTAFSYPYFCKVQCSMKNLKARTG